VTLEPGHAPEDFNEVVEVLNDVKGSVLIFAKANAGPREGKLTE